MDAAKNETRRGRIEHRYAVKVVDNDEKAAIQRDAFRKSDVPEFMTSPPIERNDFR